jgi:hypothetical protein
VSTAEVRRWVERLPGFTLAGHVSPDAEAVARHLAEWWLPDEAIAYIGKATNLANRVGQYYRTPLGDAKPHAGGHWIKTLSVLNQLTVHYAEVPDVAPETVEDRMLSLFMAGVSAETRARHPQSALPLPFANLEGPGGRRAHALRGTRLKG